MLSTPATGCVAFDQNHIGYTATSSYLRISKNDRDNQLFRNKPSAYTLAPLGFIGVILIDTVLLPLTLIHDAIILVRGAPDEDQRPVDTYTYRYRQTIHTLIVSQ